MCIISLLFIVAECGSAERALPCHTKNFYTPEVIMDAKTTGIVAYLTWIGWLIAFLAGDKEGAKFHINQALVLAIASTICGIIPFVGWVAEIFVIVCWFIGFIGAINGEETEIPLLGTIKLIK